VSEQLPRQRDGDVRELERVLRSCWPDDVPAGLASTTWARLTERRIARLEREVRRLDWLLVIVTLIAVAGPLVVR
jgi:hypothetical protein